MQDGNDEEGPESLCG